MTKIRNVRRKKRKFTGNRFTRKVASLGLQEEVSGAVNMMEEDDIQQPVSVSTSSVDMVEKVENVNCDADEEDVEYFASEVASSSEPPISFKKLVNNMDFLTTFESSSSNDNEYDCHDYQIMDMDILSSMISCLACPECSSEGITLKQNKAKYGLAIQYFMRCPKQECAWEKIFWSSSKPEKGRGFDVNTRVIYAMRRIGVGLAGMKTFLTHMNLPSPMNHSAYDKLSKKIHRAVKEVSMEVMKEAAREVHDSCFSANVVDACSSFPINTSNDDADDFTNKNDNVDITVDTSVSVDGTWQRRGFTSLNGAVVAISTETGKVLDVEVMLRYCQACVTNAPLENSDPAKFEDFQASHQSECSINHKGSAPAMEAEGAKSIFRRSVDKDGLRYLGFYGDGDSKSFSAVENIYPGEKVIKYECVGHVQKRMGTRLRKRRKEKSLGGAGRLTDKMIDKLQNYYGIAIRRNAGKTVEEMKRAIWGGIFHAISSKAKAYHNHCDVSWCRFLQDINNKTNTYVPGPGLPLDCVKEVREVLTDLTNDELLKKCLHGRTQNQNESLNGMIWNRVPKAIYVGLRHLEIAVYDSVSCFNIGDMAAIRTYSKLGISAGRNMRNGCLTENSFRLSNASRQSMDAKKNRRRYLRGIRKSKSDKTKVVEGKTYKAGGF